MKELHEGLGTTRRRLFGGLKCLSAVVCALAFVSFLLAFLSVDHGSLLETLGLKGRIEPSVAWAAPALALQDATVRIQPTTSVVGVGSTFTVAVMIDDVSDLGGYEFDVYFYTPTVHVDGVADASFLGSTGRTVYPITPTIDNEIGLLSFAAFSYHTPTIAGPNGTGALATITLTAQGVGTTTLDLRNVQVVNTQAVTQPVSVEDGTVTVVFVPANFDGDGKTDIAVYGTNNGDWWMLESSSGFSSYLYRSGWGGAGYDPVLGDYDGDGKTDIAVYGTNTGDWWVLESSSGFSSYLYRGGWGGAGYDPVLGDYDGDGKTDIAVYGTNTGDWWVLESSSGFSSYLYRSGWGGAGYDPVLGDYDGDGKTDIAVYGTNTGDWWVLESSSGFSNYLYRSGWGGPGYNPP